MYCEGCASLYPHQHWLSFPMASHILGSKQPSTKFFSSAAYLSLCRTPALLPGWLRICHPLPQAGCPLPVVFPFSAAWDLLDQEWGSCDVHESLTDVLLCFPQTDVCGYPRGLKSAWDWWTDGKWFWWKSWEVSFAQHEWNVPRKPLYLWHVCFFVPCLILSFPGHSHAHCYFKIYTDSTFKITSLFNILTGNLGQAEVVVMDHRGENKAADPQKSG